MFYVPLEKVADPASIYLRNIPLCVLALETPVIQTNVSTCVDCVGCVYAFGT